MPRIEFEFSDGRKEDIGFEGELVGFKIYGKIRLEKDKVENKLPNLDKLIKVASSNPKEAIEIENILDKTIREELLKSGNTYIGTWRTSDERIVEIFKLHESNKYWLGKCKDCGDGKDDLIYDLNGIPMNYPEFGKLMVRLNGSASFEERKV